MEVARDAAERGWWVDYGLDMGVRRAVYADLEAGASRIREFQQTCIPGLLQIPEFTRQRSDADAVLRQGGPAYDVVLDEFAVRRWSAPPQVLRRQLEYLVELLPATHYLRAVVVPTAVYAVAQDWGSGGGAEALSDRIERAAGQFATILDDGGTGRPARATRRATSTPRGW
jgi:hypothetical protein